MFDQARHNSLTAGGAGIILVRFWSTVKLSGMLGDAGRSLKRGKHVLKTVRKQRNRPHEVPARDEIPYSIEEARQRFSQWAACRAAQAGRSAGKRQELITALKQCGVVEFVEKQLHTTDYADDFEKSFFGWVDGVIGYLDKERNKQIKWGVAAKLVAIYLKGAFIFNAGEKSKLARLIAPPIDSILLRGIDKHFGTRLSKMPDYKWTKLKPRTYKNLIRKLRDLNGRRPLWHIERFWNPAAD